MQTRLNFQDDTDKFGKLTKSSGKKCIEKANRLTVGSWARKFVTLLIQQDGWVSTKCKLTWKLKGTKYNRFYFQIYPSLIEKTDLLPTPKSVEAPSASWENRSPDSKYKPGVTLTDLKIWGMLPTPTTIDSSKDGDMSASAKMLLGATHRSSGQQIQKTLTDAVHMQILKDNVDLTESLAQKQILKRTKLPNQKDFVKWIRQTTPKFLSEKSNIPQTKVEHWFRTDKKGFSHPSIEDWHIIKNYLNDWEQWDYQITYQENLEWKGLLPTPQSMDIRSDVRKPEERSEAANQGGCSNLREWAANGLLPTPKVSDVEGGVVKDVQVENGKYFRENKDGVRWGVKLRDVVETQIMPTPTATDYKGAYPPASIDNFPQRRNMIRNVYQYEKEEYDPKTCQLSPQFVLEMMGFPTDWTLIPFQKQ
jgi:hypothetical protein